MDISGNVKRSVVTIGNFDGVHAGHAALLDAAREIAQNRGLASCLVTFWPHPATILRPKNLHRPLAEREERARLLAARGFDRIIELPFDENMGALSPEEFVTRCLLPLRMAVLVMGHDFALGRNASGDFAHLAELGKKHGFEVCQVTAHIVGGEVVSSTRARRALADGAVEEAARLLGRPWSICGEVIHGEGRGTGLGFPTANIAPPQKMLPGSGVYATIAKASGREWPAITNIGNNPTFNGKNLTIETFLLTGGENLYGRELCLDFIGRIRGEIHFSGPDELAAQIEKDIRKAREILRANVLPH